MIIFIINDIISSYIFLLLCANITWHTISKIINFTLYILLWHWYSHHDSNIIIQTRYY